MVFVGCKSGTVFCSGASSRVPFCTGGFRETALDTLSEGKVEGAEAGFVAEDAGLGGGGRVGATVFAGEGLFATGCVVGLSGWSII